VTVTHEDSCSIRGGARGSGLRRQGPRTGRATGGPFRPSRHCPGREIVEEVARVIRAIERVLEAARSLTGPLAVRSSAVDEDGATQFRGPAPDASQCSIPRRPERGDKADLVSANSDSVITTASASASSTARRRVVVQSLLAPRPPGDVHPEPINGADERIIEASWDSESRVSGRVIPTPTARPVGRSARADGGSEEDCHRSWRRGNGR